MYLAKYIVWTFGQNSIVPYQISSVPIPWSLYWPKKSLITDRFVHGVDSGRLN